MTQFEKNDTVEYNHTCVCVRHTPTHVNTPSIKSVGAAQNVNPMQLS